LLRQNATIEPVDTSRGVGKHLVSLLTTASKETTSIKTGNTFYSYHLDLLSYFRSIGYKQSSRDVVIEERYKVRRIRSFKIILHSIYFSIVGFKID
jgi:hypothetical protein